MFQRAFEHVGEDFHVAVRVGVEAAALADAVVVDHQQIRKAHVLRVVVAAKGKAVLRIQPTEIGKATRCGRSDFQHVVLLRAGCGTGSLGWPPAPQLQGLGS
ncbi:hypothetical protein D3C81_2069660 [compost metagenome]